MKKAIALLCLLLAYGYSPIQAQEKDTDSGSDSGKQITELKNTINLFVGGGIGNNPNPVSYIAGFTVYNKHLATTLRYIHESEDFTNDNYDKKAWDYAVLFGPALKYKQFICSASAGISMIGGVHGIVYNYGVPGSEEDTFSGFGFPLGLQATWTPIKHLGAGIYTYADFNKYQSMYGLTLTLSVLF